MRKKRSIVGLTVLCLFTALVIPHAAFAAWDLSTGSTGHTVWAILGVATMGLLGLILQTALELRTRRGTALQASEMRISALDFHLALFLRVGKSITGFAARLGLILAEVGLLILMLLLFDIAML